MFCIGLILNHLFDSVVDPETHILPYYLSLCPVGERTCSSNQFTCPTWYPGHPRCVPLNAVCDGEKDCANAADELQNCPIRNCHMNEFACANGLCILIPYQCV